MLNPADVMYATSSNTQPAKRKYTRKFQDSPASKKTPRQAADAKRESIIADRKAQRRAHAERIADAKRKLKTFLSQQAVEIEIGICPECLQIVDCFSGKPLTLPPEIVRLIRVPRNGLYQDLLLARGECPCFRTPSV